MFSLVFLPDTQSYCDTRLKFSHQLFNMGDQRECFFEQMKWVLENREELNIRYVLHGGDLTQSNHEDEWAIAAQAFQMIEAEIPYLVTIGNHDQGYSEKPSKNKTWVSHRRDSLFDQYFHPRQYQEHPLYNIGGVHGPGNRFDFFEADEMKFLILSLAFLPTDSTLTWANEVIAKHPNHRVIVMTHGYLDFRGRRDLRENHFQIKGNSAQKIWDQCLKKHANIFLVLCGHDYGEAARIDQGIAGNRVHQLMANYQWWENGGSGWLRILQFHPEKNHIQVKTFSPVSKQYRKSKRSQFLLYYPMKEETFSSLSDFQKHKIKHYFSLIDSDGDGFLSKSDFLGFSERLANIRGIDENSTEYRQLIHNQEKWWTSYHLLPEKNRYIDIRVVLNYWNMIAAADREDGKAYLESYLDAVLKIIVPHDKDHILSVEFMLFLKAMGIPRGQLNAFRHMDVTEKGFLTKKELETLAVDFFLGSDPNSPSKWFFGPLPMTQ